MGETMNALCKEKAITKLNDELKKAKETHFAQPILSYLIKRCEEDNGLCEDVCQEHKNWDKCFKYVYEQARKFAKGARQCAVRDDVVFEWAEDYYHKDDKAEEEEKAKKDAERKKKEAERKAVSVPDKVIPMPVVKETVQEAEKVTPKVDTKPTKKGKVIEGQMDLFSMIGM